MNIKHQNNRVWKQVSIKSFLTLSLATILMVACGDTEEKLRERAAELCAYVPDHQLLEKSKDYMTEDFYAVLDTMFNHLPEFEVTDHEWLYYFVTGNGGTIADYEVKSVELTDKTHAVATILVRQKWEDGSFDETMDVEEHQMLMEKVDGIWLMSDFDNHKQDCIRHITLNREEQAIRNAISDYLVKSVGQQYLKGELCIPTLLVVAAEEDADTARVWCDNHVYWYSISGDTLKTVSGGNHSGLMTLVKKNGRPIVTNFEQTTDGAGNEASARRIFGSHYDVYQNIHSHHEVSEAARKEQLKEYVRQNGLAIRYYQDYGWDAVEL